MWGAKKHASCWVRRRHSPGRWIGVAWRLGIATMAGAAAMPPLCSARSHRVHAHGLPHLNAQVARPRRCAKREQRAQHRYVDAVQHQLAAQQCRQGGRAGWGPAGSRSGGGGRQAPAARRAHRRRASPCDAIENTWLQTAGPGAGPGPPTSLQARARSPPAGGGPLLALMLRAADHQGAPGSAWRTLHGHEGLWPDAAENRCLHHRAASTNNGQLQEEPMESPPGGNWPCCHRCACPSRCGQEGATALALI